MAGNDNTSQAILPGAPPIEIHIRRSAQSRRLSLRVSAFDGRVTLSLPPRVRLAEGLSFAREREEWIRDALSGHAAPRRIAPDAVMPVEGHAVTLTEAPVLRVVPAGDLLLVPAGEARFAPRVLAYLRQLAAQRIEAACRHHAERLGRRYGRISLRDTRSRWGSCTSDGRLMFSWRLILAPPEVLDYVAAHEVAHLAEMNHSPAFWHIVAGLVPDYALHRHWLAVEGAGLHLWQAPVSAGRSGTERPER